MEERKMAGKIEIGYSDQLGKTLSVMGKMGLLLVSADSAGKPNAMTIGWGTVGIIWGKPIFTVLVRPSRYTYNLMEQSADFTVNVPTPNMADIVAFCGSKSGRDYDKFKEKGLIALSGKNVKSPIIEQCAIHYECKIVHKNDVMKDNLEGRIVSSAYKSGDFHTIYYGEILGVYASLDLLETP
jgi:flavin reductase (DIM6/NTAB) family NADH-FMN oxidoreductase RutF